jgi:hypothetical protein
MIKIPQEILNQSLDFENKLKVLKEGYSFSRDLNINSHSLSKWGEWLFAQEFGLEDQINWAVHPRGDKYDFKVGNQIIDVKTTTYFKYPELKCFAEEDQAHIFVLTTIDQTREEGRLVGYVSKTRLFDKSRYWCDYRGLGKRYVMLERQLTKDWKLLKRYLNYDT